MKKLKLIGLLILLLWPSTGRAYDDFIITNYGFATDGLNFYVDETGYMVLKEALEVKRLYVNGHSVGGVKGQDLVAASNVELGWDGDYFHVIGNADVYTLSNIYADGQRVTLYFTGTPTLHNQTSGGAKTSSMHLKGSVNAQGPIVIEFVKDAGVWRELSRTEF